MDLTSCIFYTGALHAPIPDPPAARERLNELFFHSDRISSGFSQELQAAGICLPASPIRVVSISPGPEAEFTMGFAEAFAETISNKLINQLAADGIFYYISSKLQGVVSAGGPEDTAALYETLREIVANSGMQARPHAAISNAYDSLEAISRACVENEEARFFERFLTHPIDVLVQPKDFHLYGAPFPEADDDTFFGEVSQKICNAMLLEDQARMHQALDQALDFIVDRFPRVSGIHMRAIHFCKPLEMTLVGADLIDRLFVQQFRLVQRVIETENEAQLRESFHQQLDRIWEYSQKRKQLHHGELMQRVADYIQQNLSDFTLSIPTIAENFHLSETWLSADFRQYFQETIPNFIHQHRVEWIKTQLRTTKRPIREISMDAGYISIATMNRAFFRLEGLYPGQYRKKHSILSFPPIDSAP